MTYVYDERAIRKDYREHGQIILIPPTTDSALVFPYDKSTKSFDRKFYSPALTDGRLHSNQVETFLTTLETKVNKKIRKAQQLTKLFAGIALFAVTILALYGFCLFSESDYVDDVDASEYYNDVDSFFIALMGFAFATMFYSIILTIYRKRCYKKAKKSAERYIKKHNPEFASMGLRWNLPLSFPQWVELWKDYKGQGQNTFEQAPPMTQPQTQHAYTIPIQTKPLSQYPVLPALTQQNSSNNQNQQNYRGNVMSQPLLAQQSQESVNYMPPQPHQLHYSNFEN